MAPVKRGKPAKPRTGRALASIEKIDIAIARTVALDEERPIGRWLGRFAELGDQPPLRVLCGATIASGIARSDPKLFRTGLRMALAHSIATAAKAVVKDGVDRTRPAAALDTGEYKLKPGDSEAHDLQSMPSGHSAGVTALVGAALIDYPDLKVPAISAGGSILAAQLPSRNHFLSDVIVGGAVGLAALAVARAVLPAKR